MALCMGVGVVFAASAQRGVEIVGARFEPDSVLLGDHFDLVLEVAAPEGYGVGFPTINAEFAEGKIELIDERALDTVRLSEGSVQLRKRWRMTSFEPAMYSIDSIGVLYTDGVRVDTLFASEPLRLEVQMMPVDTAQKTIYDIKQPLPMPVKVAEFAGYTGVGLLIAALVAGIVLLIVRAVRRKSGVESAKPKEPAHVVAIRHLEMLHNQKLWQNGKIKEYYSRLTEILREYLAGRYGVGAMEMTTDEIVTAMKSLELSAKQSSGLGTLLAESDLVKFAKYLPNEEYHEEAYNTVYYFVEESKEIAEEIVAPEAQNLEGVATAEERKEGQNE